MPELFCMDREGSGVETFRSQYNHIVYYGNSTAENILHATDSLHVTTLLIHSD